MLCMEQLHCVLTSADVELFRTNNSGLAVPQKLKEKRKQAAQGTVVWQHRPFTNPARKDGLQV